MARHLPAVRVLHPLLISLCFLLVSVEGSPSDASAQAQDPGITLSLIRLHHLPSHPRLPANASAGASLHLRTPAHSRAPPRTPAHARVRTGECARAYSAFVKGRCSQVAPQVQRLPCSEVCKRALPNSRRTQVQDSAHASGLENANGTRASPPVFLPPHSGVNIQPLFLM